MRRGNGKLANGDAIIPIWNIIMLYGFVLQLEK